MEKEIFWTEAYRPQTVEHCILPDRIKAKFQEYVQQDVISNNLILHGTSGVGKTTIALATVKQLGSEYLFVNASTHGNIDMLRGQVAQFATTMSFNDQRKYVIFDEAERLTAATQDGIRGFIEEYSQGCGFIFTCNNVTKINDAIRSRCVEVDFNFTKAEAQDLIKQYFKRAKMILKHEKIEFEPRDIANFITNSKNSLDFRNILIQLQHAAKGGKIVPADLRDKSDEHFEELVDYVKNKQYNKCREWINSHSEYTPEDVLRRFYDVGEHYFTKRTVPLLILLVGKYMEMCTRVADDEITLLCFFIECMTDLEFK